MRFNPMMMLHDEQYLEIKRPLPTAATIPNQTHVSAVCDKGSGAVIVTDVHCLDENGEEVAFKQSTLFIHSLCTFAVELHA